jgi:uncharacterized protein YndB with AHSA1/START domain
MPTYLFLAIAAAVVVFVAVATMQPAAFRVERRTVIAAPAAAVFGRVNALREWTAWSPWEKLDPALRRTYEGPAAGEGAVYSWAGNKKVGEGRMTIVESRPAELIRIKLEFLKPWQATNATEFVFTSDGGKTAVVWSMSGTKNAVMKAVCLFTSMDKMVGGDFERGLAQLKGVVEGAA